MLGQLAEKERPKAALPDSSGFALLASPNMASTDALLAPLTPDEML